MTRILIALVCLAAFSEAFPQAKYRKVHIQGRPGENVSVRDRIIVPAAPVLEEEPKVANIGVAPVVEEIQSIRPQGVNRNKKSVCFTNMGLIYDFI